MRRSAAPGVPCTSLSKRSRATEARADLGRAYHTLGTLSLGVLDVLENSSAKRLLEELEEHGLITPGLLELKKEILRAREDRGPMFPVG
jgi:hypothetical protein